MFETEKEMKLKKQSFTGCKTLLSVAVALSSFGTHAFADGYYRNNDNRVTLIEMGDLHGTLVSHQAVLKNTDGTEYNVESSGGLAKLKTVVDDIRGDNPEAVLLSVGDLTHGP